MLFFWSTGKIAKKKKKKKKKKKIKKKGKNIGLICRQNENSIWFLGTVFFKKTIFCIAKQKENAKCVIYYNNDKCFLVLVIYMFAMSYFIFLQNAEIL